MNGQPSGDYIVRAIAKEAGVRALACLTTDLVREAARRHRSTPVATAVVSNARRDEVVERVRAACAEGRQAYWVCTLIEESETLEAQAAEAIAAELAERLPALRVGLVHGRVPGRQRLEIMNAFKAGEIELLVATTVIEVGVDVPNATVMLVEGANRFLRRLWKLVARQLEFPAPALDPAALDAAALDLPRGGPREPAGPVPAPGATRSCHAPGARRDRSQRGCARPAIGIPQTGRLPVVGSAGQRGHPSEHRRVEQPQPDG